MIEMKSARILGLGLMGTNLGLKLLREGVYVNGVDINPTSVERASSLGINTTELFY